MNRVHNIIILILILGLLTIPAALAQNNNTELNLNSGESVRVNCDGSNLNIDIIDAKTIDLNCVGTVVNTPTPTNTAVIIPTATNTSVPTDTPMPISTNTVIPTNTIEPTVNPSPTNTPSAIADFGLFPNCKAPAIPLETHSWWKQNGESIPRHVHVATCAPNARNLDGGGVAVNQDVTFDTLVTVFNNSAEMSWVLLQVYGDDPDGPGCPSGIDCTYLNDISCTANPEAWDEVVDYSGVRQCKKWVKLTFDYSEFSGGLKEFRFSPKADHEDLGTRQFPTLNFQIYVESDGENNYRNFIEPMNRSWYTGVEYAVARWQNYMDLYTNLNQSIPVVSGVIDLDVRHTQCSGDSNQSIGYLDPDFHHAQTGGGEPTKIYERDGCFTGTVQLDTTKLSNGLHTIYLQTKESNSDGFNAGAGKYWIEVNN